MNINLDRLGVFGRVATAAGSGGCDTIQIDDGGKLRVGAEYRSTDLIGRLRRSKADQKMNNNARSELLVSLANAFGTELGRDNNGQVVFSRAFMDSLEKTLGKDVLLKGDFGIDSEGHVASGSPLTERRITAIVNRVHELAKPKSDRIKSIASLLTTNLAMNHMQLDGPLDGKLAGKLAGKNRSLTILETAKIMKTFREEKGRPESIDTLGKISDLIFRATGLKYTLVTPKGLDNRESSAWRGATFTNFIAVGGCMMGGAEDTDAAIREILHEKSRTTLRNAIATDPQGVV